MIGYLDPLGSISQKAPHTWMGSVYPTEVLGAFGNIVPLKIEYGVYGDAIMVLVKAIFYLPKGDIST